MEQTVAECCRQKVPEALDSNTYACADITVRAERKRPLVLLAEDANGVEATTGVA